MTDLPVPGSAADLFSADRDQAGGGRRAIVWSASGSPADGSGAVTGRADGAGRAEARDRRRASA